MKKIGFSTWTLQSTFGPLRTLEIASECGFDAIDFDLSSYGGENDPIYKRGDAMAEHFTKIKERAEEIGIMISQTHGRCRTYTPLAEECNYAKWVSERDLLATSILGAPACVIHNISTCSWGPRQAEFMHKKNAEFINDITPFAERYGVNIGFETFGDATFDGERYVDFFGDSGELLTQFRMAKTKNKVLCMDTGHTNKACCAARERGYTVPSVEDSIRLFGKDLGLLHLNDNNSYSDQHLPPLWAGYLYSVKWDAVMEALDGIGYSGVYNFELNLDHFGSELYDVVHLLGKYLRSFINKYE